MKLLLDQHVSRTLVASIQTAFPGSAYVVHHGLEERDDDSIWEFERVNGYAILSKDSDFVALSFVRGHPPKVVWLTIGNSPTATVRDVLLRAAPLIEEFFADPDRSLMTLGWSDRA